MKEVRFKAGDIVAPGLCYSLNTIGEYVRRIDVNWNDPGCSIIGLPDLGSISISNVGKLPKSGQRRDDVLRHPGFIFVGAHEKSCMKRGFLPSSLYDPSAADDAPDRYLRYLHSVRDSEHFKSPVNSIATGGHVIIGCYHDPGKGYADYLKMTLMAAAKIRQAELVERLPVQLTLMEAA